MGESVMTSKLKEGIGLHLCRCSALQTVMKNEPKKAQQLTFDIYQCLTTPPSSKTNYIHELEDLLNEFMLSFNLEITDGSLEMIALDLGIFREECLQGNFSSIEPLRWYLRSVPPTSSQHIKVVTGGEYDDDSELLEMTAKLNHLQTPKRYNS